jgi:hypothetical protein
VETRPGDLADWQRHDIANRTRHERIDNHAVIRVVASHTDHDAAYRSGI